MKFLLLEETDSTNSYVSVHASELESNTMVIANHQRAGRGQRGNSWESEPGKNLLFTMLIRPERFAPRHQFSISEATALAVCDFLRRQGVEAKVKWPNDVYVGDRKICGILIEHSVTSEAIEHSRIGVGLNINQEEFVSDAPNPVSLRQLTGEEYDISRVAAAVGALLESRLATIGDASVREAIHAEFKQNLWRGDGKPHTFRLRGECETFEGIIDDVDPFGPITIINQTTMTAAQYAFKEVEFVLPQK